MKAHEVGDAVQNSAELARHPFPEPRKIRAERLSAEKAPAECGRAREAAAAPGQLQPPPASRLAMAEFGSAERVRVVKAAARRHAQADAARNAVDAAPRPPRGLPDRPVAGVVAALDAAARPRPPDSRPRLRPARHEVVGARPRQRFEAGVHRVGCPAGRAARGRSDLATRAALTLPRAPAVGRPDRCPVPHRAAARPPAAARLPVQVEARHTGPLYRRPDRQDEPIRQRMLTLVLAAPPMRRSAREPPVHPAAPPATPQPRRKRVRRTGAPPSARWAARHTRVQPGQTARAEPMLHALHDWPRRHPEYAAPPRMTVQSPRPALVYRRGPKS